MTNLEDLLDFLGDQISELDKLWKLLDQASTESPSVLMDRIYLHADRFHAAYTDVFRKAIEEKDVKVLHELTREYLENAGDEVAGAWETIASHNYKLNDAGLEIAKKLPSISLKDIHLFLDEIKDIISEADEKRGNNDYLGSIEKYKECIKASRKCELEIEDAIRAHKRDEIREAKEERREKRYLGITLKQGIILALITGGLLLIVTISSAVLGPIISSWFTSPSQAPSHTQGVK